jgi:hypothetical protein
VKLKLWIYLYGSPKWGLLTILVIIAGIMAVVFATVNPWSVIGTWIGVVLVWGQIFASRYRRKVTQARRKTELFDHLADYRHPKL